MNRRLPRMVVFALSLAFVAGCGGNTDEASSTASSDDGGSTSQTTTTTTTATSDAAGLENQTFEVGQDFWHSGFHITVDSGEISSKKDDLTDKVTDFLQLQLTLENTGTDSGFINTDMAVATADNTYPGSPLNDLGEVPGGASSQGELTFLIDESFDLSSAELVVGSADVTQARVPLATMANTRP